MKLPFSATSPFAHLARAAVGGPSVPSVRPAALTSGRPAVASESDDDDEENKKTKKTKKGKAKDDDEQDRDDEDDEADENEDEEDEEDPKARAARRREKRRIRAIVNSKAGQRLPGLALKLALDTTMTRRAAIGALKEMALDVRGGGRGSLADRMAGVSHYVGLDAPSASAEPGSPEAKAAAIIRAGMKARGEID